MRPDIWADTSFLYALFVSRDGNHRTAQDLWRQVQECRLTCVTSNLVYAELGSLLAHRFGHDRTFGSMSLLLDSALIRVVYADSRVHVSALGWWRQFGDQKFSLVDCISFEFMRRLGMSHVLSFDSDFTVAGYTVVSDAAKLSEQRRNKANRQKKTEAGPHCESYSHGCDTTMAVEQGTPESDGRSQ